jgi:molybdopterin/thiamine biosynthesis adenylyltransferase
MSRHPKSVSEVLSPDFLDKDKHDRTKRTGWVDLGALSATKVLIVGAGALGNEVAKDLVLAGFRHISIVDMDHVVASNLNRCLFFTDPDAEERRPKAEVVAEGLRRMEPEVRVDARTSRIQDLGDDFIPGHGVVFGCLDNVEARLHVNAHCYHSRVPLIDGGIAGFVGRVQVVLPPDTPCLECSMNRTHRKVLEDRFSCTGEDVTYFEPKLAAEITTTSVISAVQVREAVKIASGLRDAVLRDMFYYDGVTNDTGILEIPVNPDCPHHREQEASKSIGGGGHRTHGGPGRGHPSAR